MFVIVLVISLVVSGSAFAKTETPDLSITSQLAELESFITTNMDEVSRLNRNVLYTAN
jgi:hypothetical protein